MASRVVVIMSRLPPCRKTSILPLATPIKRKIIRDQFYASLYSLPDSLYAAASMRSRGSNRKGYFQRGKNLEGRAHL